MLKLWISLLHLDKPYYYETGADKGLSSSWTTCADGPTDSSNAIGEEKEIPGVVRDVFPDRTGNISNQ